MLPPEDKSDTGTDEETAPTNEDEERGTLPDVLSLLQTMKSHIARESRDETTLKHVIDGLTRLGDCDEEDMEEEQVFGWASALLLALENGTSNLTKWQALEHAFHPNFIVALFALRRRFRPESLYASDQRVINFADILITRLCPFSGENQTGEDTQSKAWSRLVEEERLRSAASLPLDPSQMPDYISHPMASPGARRLALAILWGLYALSPSPSENNSTNQKNMQERSKVAHSLEVHADRLQSASSADRSIAPLECLSYAYMLALFAVTADSATFRPSTHTSLLSLLNHILCQSAERDLQAGVWGPLEVLLGSGSFVSWAWNTWGSGGEGGDAVEQLTELWLHYNSLKDPSDTQWLSQLDADPQRAISVLLNILKRSPPSSSIFWQSLFMAYIQVPALMDAEPIAQAVLASSMIIMIGDCSIQVKELIVQLWTVETTALVAAVLEGDEGEPTIRAVMGFLERAISAQDSTKMEAVKPLIDFLCIVAHCKASTALVIRRHSSFLKSLILWACETGKSKKPSGGLQESIILLVGLLEDLGEVVAMEAVTYDTARLCTFAIDYGADDIMMAAALARYVIHSAPIGKLDQLLCLEAWSYFCDVVILTLTEHYLGSLGDFACLTLPVFYTALETLLASLQEGPVQYVLASEWTVSLVSEIRSHSVTLIENCDDPSTCPKWAESLLSKIERTLKPSETVESTSVECKSWTLRYGPICGLKRLVCIPTDD